MLYFRRWIQFHSSKMAEIPLFVKMKCALSGDKPAVETIQRWPKCNRCRHVHSKSEAQERWLSPSWLSRRCAFPRRAARVNLYRQRYRQGPALYLAASITLFHPVARLDGLRFVRRITRCSSLKTPGAEVRSADSLQWQETSKLSHYGPGLWQPKPSGEEEQMCCVSRGTITLPPLHCSVCVCVCTLTVTV